MIITKPPYADAPEYYHQYFNLVPENNLLEALKNSMQLTIQQMQSLDKQMYVYAYAPGKWTIAEVFQHIIDCERILCYRAFRFSRFDDTPLAGFNEDHYIEASRSYPLEVEKLSTHYSILRQQTILLFESMNNDMLNYKGTANQLQMNARGIGFMLAGHNIHHCNVISERYLNKG